MLAGLDQAIFAFINTNLSNPVLDFFFLSVTNFGSVFFWIFLALFLLTKKDKKSFIGIALMLIIGDTISFFLKDIFAVPRPETNKVLACENTFSFPSAHAMNAFSGAFIFDKLHKGAGMLMYALAILTAISRVYLGVHYPSDVLVGSVLGLVIGYVVMRFPLDRWEKRLEKWYRKSFK
jgi:undecaprenyl-diphosphatase